MTTDRDHPILLVEDDPNDVVLIKRAYRRARVANPLHVVRDGDEAVEYLSGTGRHTDRSGKALPVLVLLDLKLPRRSGHEVLRWIRAEAGITELPVVVLTSSGETDDVRRAYTLGANSYLKKPTAFEDLQKLVETLDLYWLMLNVPGPPDG